MPAGSLARPGGLAGNFGGKHFSALSQIISDNRFECKGEQALCRANQFGRVVLARTDYRFDRGMVLNVGAY